VTGWEGAREVLTFDVTNTSHGGNTARLGGKRDGRGTIQLDFDADLPPYLAQPNIIEGVSGVVQEFVSPTRAIQTPVIIKAVKYVSSVGAQLKFTVDWEFNILAGLYVLPGV
jgi:hypothetical protein